MILEAAQFSVLWEYISKPLLTVLIGIFGYLLLENISVLKRLSQIVADFQQEFAAHKQSDKNTERRVESLEKRADKNDEERVELKLKVNTIVTKLKIEEDD